MLHSLRRSFPRSLLVFERPNLSKVYDRTTRFSPPGITPSQIQELCQGMRDVDQRIQKSPQS
ncbi:hypothetical protein EMIT0194P_30123 [Pseudomonas serbica]